MFNPNNFCHIASNNRNRMKASIFLYKAKKGEEPSFSGFFNPKADELNLYDLILVVYEDNFAPYDLFRVIRKTTDTVSVNKIMQRELSSLWDAAAIKKDDFMTPVTDDNKGATETEINELIERLTTTQGDLTDLINTKATKATDFVTPITDSNKGITQTEQEKLKASIDRAATSGQVIGGYWFGKTVASYTPPKPTYASQNYFDFTTNTPYTAKSDLSGWTAGTVITLPADLDVQILITSKFWNIPEQNGQQGGKAYWSHTDKDWAYYPQIVSFESPALTGTPTTPTPTASSNNSQVANKGYVNNQISASMLALKPLGIAEPFFGNTIPAGYYECNGQSIIINSENRALATALGYPSSAATMLMPDLRDGVPIGSSGAQGHTPRAHTNGIIPNITASYHGNGAVAGGATVGGAFYKTSLSSNEMDSGWGNTSHSTGLGFNARNSSTVYTDGATSVIPRGTFCTWIMRYK